MRGRTTYALPVILALAASGAAITILTADAASAATCLASPDHTAPKGSRWYYRIDFANHQRKCWHLVSKDGGARETAKAAPQTKQVRKQVAAPVAPAPTEVADEPAPPAQDPQQFITRDVSNVGPDDARAMPPAEQPPAPAADTTAPQVAAMAPPAEAAPAPAAAPADVSNLSPPVERPAPQAKIAAAAEPQPTSLLQYVFLVLVLIGLAGGGVLYVAEMRRRRNDVLRVSRRPAMPLRRAPVAQEEPPMPRRVRLAREEPPMAHDPREDTPLADDFETALRQLAQLRTQRRAA